MDNNFIRKLDRREVGVLKGPTGRSMMAKYRIRSRFDLFSETNINHFKTAIVLLKQRQKLLRTRIKKLGEDDYYYIYDPDGVESLKNVKFLSVGKTSNLELVNESVANLLLEHFLLNDEIHVPESVNENSELLWKLYVFERDRVNYLYDIFIYYNHVISQAQSVWFNIYMLLYTLESILTNKKVDSYEYEAFPGCESMFSDFQQIFGEEYPCVKIPGFIDPNRAMSSSSRTKPLPDYLDPNLDVFDITSGETRSFLSIRELLESSRRNHMKFKRFEIEPNMLSKILLKCKSEGAKLNSFLEIIMCLAIMSLYEKHGEQIDQIVYLLIVNIRQFIKNGVVDEKAMGLATSTLLTKPDMSELKRARENLSEAFWPLVKSTSIRLHERLDSGEWKKKLNLKRPNEHEMFIQCGLTNVGARASYVPLDVFSFEDSIGFFTFDRREKMGLFKSIIYQENNRRGALKWIVMYDSHFVDEFLVDEIIELYKLFINQVFTKSNL